MLKKIFIFGVFLFFCGEVVLAQNEALSGAGLTPDSPFYFLEIIAEKIGNFFTFGDKAKAERMLDLMDERMAEAQKMLKEKKIEPAKKAFERYQKHFQEFEKRLEKMGKGREPFDDVVERVAFATEKHIAVLEKVYEKAPYEAKNSILRVMGVSLRGQENALFVLNQRNSEKALKLQLKIMDQRIERVKLRIENKNLVAAKEAFENYERGKKRAEFFLKSVKKMEKNPEKIKKLEKLVFEKTAKHIEVLFEIYKKAPDQAKPGILRAIENSMRSNKKIEKLFKEKLEKIKREILIPEKIRKELKKEKKKNKTRKT